MAQMNSISLSDRSRLVGMICDLTDLNLNTYDYNLAERLGSFLGVSGSMNLARGIKNLPSSGSGIKGGSSHAVIEEFLDSRERLVKQLIDSFSSSDVHNSVPSEANGVRREALYTFTPFQRFYTAKQVEMGVAVKHLRDFLRRDMSIMSVKMQRLSQMDLIFDENLEGHIRKQFNIVPKALEHYFYASVSASDKEFDLDTFLPEFYLTMRDLLLAELDARMQPLIGLVEALQEYEEQYE